MRPANEMYNAQAFLSEEERYSREGRPTSRSCSISSLLKPEADDAASHQNNVEQRNPG
jgi:hypothetical protein